MGALLEDRFAAVMLHSFLGDHPLEEPLKVGVRPGPGTDNASDDLPPLVDDEGRRRVAHPIGLGRLAAGVQKMGKGEAVALLIGFHDRAALAIHGDRKQHQAPAVEEFIFC